MEDKACATNFLQRVYVRFEVKLKFCYWGKTEENPEITKTVLLESVDEKSTWQEANEKAEEWGEELKKKGYKGGRILSSLTKKTSCLAPLIIVGI